jgi:hypothetical protein
MGLRANDYSAVIAKRMKRKGLRRIGHFSRRGKRVRALRALPLRQFAFAKCDFRGISPHPPTPPSQGGERKCAFGVADSRGHDWSPDWWRRMASINGQNRVAGRSDQSPNTAQSTQRDERVTQTRNL